MKFTVEERARILKHRMGELKIDTFAEVARRAKVDRGNLSTMVRTGVGLSAELRDQVADVLQVDRDQLAHLFDPEFDTETVTVRVGIELDPPEDPALLEKRARELAKRRALRAGEDAG